jgi:hypothetical protein
MSTSTYALLAHCARLSCAPSDADQLARLTAEFTAWDSLPGEAEAHGLGPLLYTYLLAAGVVLPRHTKRALQALTLRHRHANQVRAQVLVEILMAFQAAGITAVVLKGAALAHLLYPQPGLRPMRDLDVLVKKAKARQAQALLADLGFLAPLPHGSTLPGKHLAAAYRTTEGLRVSVEIHHNLFNDDLPAIFTLDHLTRPPLPVSINDLTAYTLPGEEMLWHLCQHLNSIGQPLRLIWVADIVGLAERLANELNWARIKRNYPLVHSTLSLLHFISPLSDDLRQRAGLDIGPPPTGICQEFQGWPRTSVGQQRGSGKSYGRILADTFWPSEWWLRLYYGLGSAGAIGRHRWVIHPLRVLGWVNQLLRERVSRREKSVL